MNTKANILVVDDEAGIRYFITETLTDAGYNVLAVESAEKALDKQQEQHFDLALIDLKLPDMDGIALLSELRQYAPNLEIIVLTGHASLETAVQALRQGARDYLFKPCEPDQLRESVSKGLLKRSKERDKQQVINQLETYFSKGLDNILSNALENTSMQSDTGSDDPTITNQSCVLNVDTTRHIITIRDQVLPLTPTEFALLTYLVNQAPRVITAEELALETLGYTGDSWEIGNLIRTHIYRIRKKIHAIVPEMHIISTVRGIGYRIDQDLL